MISFSDWEGTQTTIGNTKYWGQYYDKDGSEINAPFMVGYFENFKLYNVSFTIWTLLPNVNEFNQKISTQVNYSSTGQNTLNLPLLKSSDLVYNNPDQPKGVFDMNFCFQKYYLNITGAINEN
jgi:hypothetical protein